jgi:hypothetical protein
MAVSKKLRTEFIAACDRSFKGAEGKDDFGTMVEYLYGPVSEYGVNDVGDKMETPLDVGMGQLWEGLALNGWAEVRPFYKEAKALEAMGQTLERHPLDPAGHLYG